MLNTYSSSQIPVGNQLVVPAGNQLSDLTASIAGEATRAGRNGVNGVRRTAGSREKHLLKPP